MLSESLRTFAVVLAEYRQTGRRVTPEAIEAVSAVLGVSAKEAVALGQIINQVDAIAPFLAAARAGMAVREAISALRSDALNATEIDCSAAMLGLIAAMQRLHWRDFAALEAAWGGK
jgi:hypothetical protein